MATERLYSEAAEADLKELDRIAMLPYRWDESKIIENLKDFYKLYSIKFPRRVTTLVDIFDTRLIPIFDRQAWQVGQVGQAWQVGQARQARQARQAWQDWQARQARQAWQAWQAWQARQARQARQAWQARQAYNYATDYWEEWASVYTPEYARTNPINENDQKFMDGQKLLLSAKEAGLGFFVDDEESSVVYLIPCATVRLNEANRHHSHRFPAIEWKDGAKFYYLNGVNFPEELWQQVVSGEMPFKDILAIQDTDQRTQAMRYGNVKDFITHAKGKLLDTATKTKVDGTTINYSLYKFPSGDIFTQDAYYMVYDDVVPGSDKWYMSGVVKSETVAEAMSWKFSDDQHTLSPVEWEALVPGVTMN